MFICQINIVAVYVDKMLNTKHFTSILCGKIYNYILP